MPKLQKNIVWTLLHAFWIYRWTIWVILSHVTDDATTDHDANTIVTTIAAGVTSGSDTSMGGVVGIIITMIATAVG